MFYSYFQVEANNIWEIRGDRDTLNHTFKNNYILKLQFLKISSTATPQDLVVYIFVIVYLANKVGAGKQNRRKLL